MPYKIHEIIALAEDGAKKAPLEEMRDLYGLIANLAIHVANLDLHIKRLEMKGE